MKDKKLTLSEAAHLPCSIEDDIIDNAVQGVLPVLRKYGWHEVKNPVKSSIRCKNPNFRLDNYDNLD